MAECRHKNELRLPRSEELYLLVQTFGVNGARISGGLRHITFTAVPGARQVRFDITPPEGHACASNAIPGYTITLSRPPMKAGS